MSSVLLGLVAALSWGVNDFLARFPARAVGPVPTVLVVTFAGLVFISGWLVVSGDAVSFFWPQLWALLLAVATTAPDPGPLRIATAPDLPGNSTAWPTR